MLALLTAEAAAQLAIASALSAALVRRGLKKQSLSADGAAAAAVVGFVSMATSWTFGAILLGFYFTGSKFTAYKAAIKRRYDLEFKSGEGQRSAAQVFATAGTGCLVAAASLWHYGLAGPPGRVFRLSLLSPEEACRHIVPAFYLPGPSTPCEPLPLGTVLLIAYLAAYATVCGDTWASELGILSKREPVLVTSCCWQRRVPRGTNGGVSGWGLLLSAAGGAFVGAVAWAGVALGSFIYGSKGTVDATPQAALVLLGGVSGFVGSVIDSYLGAVLQRSWVEAATGKVTSRLPAGAKVLEGEAPAGLAGASAASSSVSASSASVGSSDSDGEASGSSSTVHASSSGTSSAAARRAGVRTRSGGRSASGSRKVSPKASPPPPSSSSHSGGTFYVVSGWDVLSNEQVNALSGALTAGLAVVACRFLAAELAFWSLQG